MNRNKSTGKISRLTASGGCIYTVSWLKIYPNLLIVIYLLKENASEAKQSRVLAK